MKKFALTTVAALAIFMAFAQTDPPTVEDTVAALQEGIADIPVDAAVANIEGWQSTLEASDDPALQELGAQLGELSAAIQVTPPNTQVIGGLLTSLGEGTVAAAGGDAQLETLGNLLSDAGGSVLDLTGEMSGGGMSGGMSGGGM